MYKSHNKLDSMSSIKLKSTATAVSNTFANPPLVLGPKTGLHVEMSGNRILSKANETTGSELYLNYASGYDVYVNNMYPTQELKTLKTNTITLCSKLVSATTVPLQNFAKIKGTDRSGDAVITATSSYISSTQSLNYVCESVAGNKTNGIDLSFYTKMNVSAANSGTTYGSPVIQIMFGSSPEDLQAMADLRVQSSVDFYNLYTSQYVHLNFTTTSQTTYTFDITSQVGIKYIGIGNTFTKWTIYQIQFTN